MTPKKREEEERRKRFEAYIEDLIAVVGHKDRAAPCRDYCVGLLLPGERKSIEPMAARTRPEAVSSQHQALHHFVAKASWSDAAVLKTASNHVLGPMKKRGGVLAWIVDDTGIPKKGIHSVGVARQYCGRLGKQDNCQVAVSLSASGTWASIPVAYRLYLPEEWAKDFKRRKKAGVPADVVFQKKWEISLSQVRMLKEEGRVPVAPVVADAGYGVALEFREGLTSLGLLYMVGIQEHTAVWTLDRPPPPVKGSSKVGRPRKRLRRDEGHQPIAVEELAVSLPRHRYKTVSWREGSKGGMTSRFAALRVRPSTRDWKRTEPHPEEWLLIEWPKGEVKPTKYWFSTLSAETSLQDLVALAKIRWRIERDYEELKGEIGLDHFEGRSWRGFHHHASLSIAAYASLVAERLFFSRLPTSEDDSRLQESSLPQGYRPRGSPEMREAS